MEESFPISASKNEAGDWREPISNFLRYDTLPVDLRERVHVRRATPRLLLAVNAQGDHRNGSNLQTVTTSFRLHTSTTRAASPNDCVLAIRSLGDGHHWSNHSQIRLRPAIHSGCHDYFSKWAEAAAYRDVKATTVTDFIRTQIIYRYGIPRYIVTDNGKPFRNKVMDRFYEKFRIQQRTSSAYNPSANGLAEAFNKTLCKILKMTIGDNKKSWDEKLGETLRAYRTLFRMPTQSTPYLLVYDTEAVLPLEVQLPSLRVAIKEGHTTEECAQLRLVKLESFNEQRLEAQQHLECYQSRITRALNKKFMTRSRVEPSQEIDPEPERTLRQKLKENQNQKSPKDQEDIESVEGTHEEQAPIPRRTMEDYVTLSPNTHMKSIITPTIQANNFEIKPQIIAMLQNHYQFSGLANEDPNEHLA
ncbi:hypothetical protein H6P81_002856 [Aristolochia fimbriata]|uniref:Integrase catalytic domain-containing protein n=1 Tax=Aristolochia fimbriata TaxID=158543 RepID=A0AAV7FB65_ARIFI|nr:hypothetical protein H6P81_002856 [Aristolochia fimbriata]